MKFISFCYFFCFEIYAYEYVFCFLFFVYFWILSRRHKSRQIFLIFRINVKNNFALTFFHWKFYESSTNHVDFFRKFIKNVETIFCQMICLITFITQLQFVFLTIKFVVVLTISTIFLRIILKCRDVDLSIVRLLIIFDRNFFKSTIITLKLRLISIFSFSKIVFRIFLKLIFAELREKKKFICQNFNKNFITNCWRVFKNNETSKIIVQIFKQFQFRYRLVDI